VKGFGLKFALCVSPRTEVDRDVVWRSIETFERSKEETEEDEYRKPFLHVVAMDTANLPPEKQPHHSNTKTSKWSSG
jgi:hypothetical protein